MSTEFDSHDSTDIHVDLGDRYMSLLNELAEEHYGRNRTNTLRRAIHELDNWHERGGDNHHLDDQLTQKLDEITESMHTLTETLEAVEKEIERYHREPVIEEGSNRQASQEAVDEVYHVLMDADRRLSPNGLIEQTNLGLVDLSLALNTLIDDGIVNEDSEESTTVDRYGLHGVTYDE